MKKFLTVLLLLGLVINSCDNDNNTETHTHDYGTAWKSNAAQHWRECSCGDKTDVADHEWEWKETTQPTATQEGEETGTCGTCGATATKTVDKLPACDCDPKEHYLPCDCGAADCTCVQIPRGYVTDTDRPDINFPIYQSAGVTDEQAVTATETIISAYAGLLPGYKNQLRGANVEIWITLSAILPEKDETGKVIMRIATSFTEAQIRAVFQNYVIPLLPQNQTATLTNLFGEGYTATVTGYFSNTEWQGSGASSVPTKIETALNGAFTTGNTAIKNRFNLVFGQGVTITVEKTSEYNSYKVIDGAFRTLYLNYDYLLSATDTDLQEKIITAVTAMRNDEAKTE